MKPIIYIIISLLLLSQSALAQPRLSKLDKKTLPKNISFPGKLVQAVQWTDSTGDHVVVLSKSEDVQASDDGISAALYAFHYLVAADSVRQLWRVYDHVEDCPVDLFLFFVEGSFAVTDLDKNGRPEVWMMYKVSCQGDASPVPMKIIMYEDNKKFAARGSTAVPYEENKMFGGEFSFDAAFKAGPPEFRKYAEKLWSKHRVEDWKH